MSGPGSSRELQGLRIEEPGKDGREKGPSNLSLSGKEMEPACLDGAPYLGDKGFTEPAPRAPADTPT